MTIKEVETMLNISRANVRFYEKEGLLFPKRNPINDYRDYSDADIAILKKIMFLRELDVSVETIRKLMQEKCSLKEVMKQQAAELADKKEKIAVIEAVCKRIEVEEEVSFLEFQVEKDWKEEKPAEKEDRTRFDFGKMMVYGVFALQILYTISILPLMPSQIPTDWAGRQITEYHKSYYLLFYVLIAPFCAYAAKLVLYYGISLWFYPLMDEINAAVCTGVILFLWGMEIYTVLSVKAVPVTFGVFFACFAVIYFLLLLVIFQKRMKKREE